MKKSLQQIHIVVTKGDHLIAWLVRKKGIQKKEAFIANTVVRVSKQELSGLCIQEFIQVKDLSSANYAGNVLIKKEISMFTKEFTLEKHHINAKNVEIIFDTKVV